MIQYLKEVTGGVPIGVKFGASHSLEQELEIFIKGGIDVLTFDATEGGTHGGAPKTFKQLFSKLCCRDAVVSRRVGEKSLKGPRHQRPSYR